MSNEERNRFRDEDDSQNDESEEGANEEEREDSEEQGGGGGKTAFLVIFIILFLISTGLLVFSQFSNGSLIGGKTNAFDTLMKDHNRLQARVDSFKMELASSKNQQESTQQQKQASQSQNQKDNDISGTYFEVQIGAFKSFDPERYKENTTNVEFHMDQGMRKITLGKFTEANAARAFRRDLVRLGLDDAFILKKRDGERLGVVESY